MKNKAVVKHGEVCYAANRFGYKVQVVVGGEAVDEYTAGNCAADSQSYIEPNSPAALHSNTLRSYARRTALEMAEEHGIPKDRVMYDVSLTDELDPEAE